MGLRSGQRPNSIIAQLHSNGSPLKTPTHQLRVKEQQTPEEAAINLYSDKRL